jgi:hypothetical protein
MSHASSPGTAWASRQIIISTGNSPPQLERTEKSKYAVSAPHKNLEEYIS